MGVFFISGSMFGGKSKNMIEIIRQVENTDECSYLVYKPSVDTRDGLFIKSRDLTTTIPARLWDCNYKFMKVKFLAAALNLDIFGRGHARYIFIDESHFISEEDIKFIVETCKHLEIDLYVGGLETNFKREYFPSSKYLKEVADGYIFLYGKCHECGEFDAVHNILYENNKRVTNGESIHVGNSEYKVFCNKCLTKF